MPGPAPLRSVALGMLSMMLADSPHNRTDPAARPTLAWLAPSQAGLASTIAEHAGLDLVRVGCSAAEKSGASAVLSKALDASPTDDLRDALASTEINTVLIGSITPDECEHTLLAPDTIKSLQQRGVRVFSLAPPPGRIGDPGQEFGSSPSPIEMIPMLRTSHGFRAVLTALESFGTIRTVSIAARCRESMGSLGARLVDAMDTARSLLGEPDTIDASIAAPVEVVTQPETLLELRGDCSAMLRYADGRSASISLTDQAGQWFRGVTILGERGCLRVDDESFEWIDSEGALIERSERVESCSEPAVIIGQAIARRLGGLTEQEDPKGRLVVIAMAEAAALSAKTGQPESPAKLLHLAGLTA